MTLIVHEIKDFQIYQSVKPDENTMVQVVRPHLYIKGTCSGIVRVQITTLDDVLISVSNEINITDISPSGEYHGYVSFNLNAHLKKDELYKIQVVCSGAYSFSESAFVGVCNGYDLAKYEHAQPITHQRFAPLDIEIWTLSRK